MAEDKFRAGILEGMREISGCRFVVLRRGPEELLIAPHLFPPDGWIEKHKGLPVQVVIRAGEALEIQPSLDPDKIFTCELVGRLVAITCAICGEVACHVPPPDAVEPDRLKAILQPFIRHLAERHPEAADEIRKVIS